MENKLEYLDEFKRLLAHYRMSNRSRQTLADTNLVLMMAPSATGRNTIIQELLKSGKYYFVVSDTTRHPRINDGIIEQNGREYWFRDEKEVLEDIKTGNFVEAAVIHGQQVSGVSIRELDKAKAQGKIAITDIQIDGVQNIIAAKPDAKAIFVLPPSFEAWMQRLNGRGQLSGSEKRRRLQSAVVEFEAALRWPYYRFVVNDTLGHAVDQIHAIAHGKLDQGVEAEGRKLAEKLSQETRDWLNQN